MFFRVSQKQYSQIGELESQRNELNDAVRKLRIQLQEQRHRVGQQKKLAEQQAANATAIEMEAMEKEEVMMVVEDRIKFRVGAAEL